MGIDHYELEAALEQDQEQALGTIRRIQQ
ncbi:hypothetical protein BQ8794_30357 [Mesorhizobium prunaredense]|uniref:Uncharacterized protein n=1 Tax=Mesorhizobium prunaredense TaxID=1631249 RepID=A0A1R3VAK7_9HYPH|nr:hypothetical protein BQ8794_30357 [Mesorhizobium prunaredense]